MTYDVYRYIFIGGAILAGLMLVLSIILFIVLHIPSVIGDLSGSTAKKAIEDIINKNESTGKKTYKSSRVNKERGKITEKMTNSGKIGSGHSDLMGEAMATTKIGTQKLQAEAREAYETALGSGAPAEQTTILGDAHASETVILDQIPLGETTVLDGGAAAPAPAASANNYFAIEFEITYIHTNEEIA